MAHLGFKSKSFSLATCPVIFWHILKPTMKFCQLNTSHLGRWADISCGVFYHSGKKGKKCIQSQEQLLCLGVVLSETGISLCIGGTDHVIPWKAQRKVKTEAKRKRKKNWSKGVRLRTNFVSLLTFQNTH